MLNTFIAGVPENNTQYGLYSPIDDCFVLTYHDREPLESLVFLFSSRYNLYLYRLDLSSNFSENLIDNTCVLNWTLAASDKPVITRFRKNFDPLPATELVCRNLPHWAMDFKDSEYLHLVLHYELLLRKLQSEEISAWGITCMTDAARLDLPFAIDIEQFKTKMYQIIFKVFDIKQAKQQLEELTREFTL